MTIPEEEMSEQAYAELANEAWESVIASDTILRHATDEDRARVLALGKSLDIPVPGTTTLSLDADKLQRLRAQFVRYNKADEALYQKLRRAETRLNERLKP